MRQQDAVPKSDCAVPFNLIISHTATSEPAPEVDDFIEEEDEEE